MCLSCDLPSWLWGLPGCLVGTKSTGKLSAQGPVFSPRIVSPHVADTLSLKTFADFPRWANLTEDERAYEIYKYLADTETGLFHMNVVSEGDDALGEYTQIRDPVKIINVYGYAYCAILGPVMAGVCEGVSLGPARTVTLPNWSHVAAETFYDNRWHYLDIDVRAVFRRPDGTLASLQESREDPTLWQDRGPLFFPNDALGSAQRIYRETKAEYYHGFQQTGHTMDNVLRPGESLTRWWRPQGGRWHHLPLYNEEDWLRRLIEVEPRGPKPNHRHFTIHDHGNGRLVYEPDLTSTSRRTLNMETRSKRIWSRAPTGLTLQRAGEGEAVFAVRSPYIIVPLVGDLDSTDDDCDASVVELDGAGVQLSLSTDNGLTWDRIDGEVVKRMDSTQDADESDWSGGVARFDLTPWVRGRYGYLLKLKLTGDPDEAIVRQMKITTWVQVAPASLPALRQGVNRMTYRTGDHYGLNTRVVEVRSRASRPEELLKYLVAPPTDYDPNRTTERIHGEATAVVQAPAGTWRIAWFTATVQFRTHFQQAARENQNTIAYSIDEGRHFETIYESDVPTYVNHWHYNAAREVRLEKPVGRLLVRYHGDPALNNFAIYAHCIADAATQLSPLHVTHVWEEDGHRKSESRILPGPGDYEIQTTVPPKNVSIEIAVPHSKR